MGFEVTIESVCDAAHALHGGSSVAAIFAGTRGGERLANCTRDHQRVVVVSR